MIIFIVFYVAAALFLGVIILIYTYYELQDMKERENYYKKLDKDREKEETQ